MILKNSMEGVDGAKVIRESGEGECRRRMPGAVVSFKLNFDYLRGK